MAVFAASTISTMTTISVTFLSQLRRPVCAFSKFDSGYSGGAAHGDPVHAQCRLADADGHALAIFAARADARVERKVGADHRDAMQVGRPVPDQHRAFHGGGHLAVFDLVGFGALENIFARRDIHLPAAEA